MRKTSHSGFTLVEMSVVLAIIGMLAGGIIVGSSLINTARIKSVGTQMQQYATAVSQFKSRFGEMPGDMPNASKIWGIAAGTISTDVICYNTNSLNNTTTCDGNGDGYVGNSAATLYERFRFWQHLTNSGLIEGNYTGTFTNAASPLTTIGTNVPASKVDKAGFAAVSEYNAAYLSTGYFGTITPNNLLVFGAKTAANYNFGAILYPEDAKNIDSKLDDGLPATGTVQSYKSGFSVVPNCTTTNSATTSDYNLQYVAKACGIVYFMTPELL